MTIEELTQRCEDLEAANLKNQQGWDTEIQGRKDDAAAHEKAIADLRTELAAVHAKEIESLKSQHQEELQAASKKHAEEIAALRASVLVPALKDMQARQAADLAAKHEAELAALQ